MANIGVNILKDWIVSLQLLPKYVDMSINVLILKTVNILHVNNQFLPWTDIFLIDNQPRRSYAYNWHTKKDATTLLNWEREQGSYLASLSTKVELVTFVSGPIHRLMTISVEGSMLMIDTPKRMQQQHVIENENKALI